MEVTGRTRHICNGKPAGSRAANLSRTTANIAKLKAAAKAGDAFIVMLTPWRNLNIAARTAIRANPDRDAALKDHTQDKYYPQVDLDDQGNKPPPPAIFYAISKSGPVARFLDEYGAAQPAVTPTAAAAGGTAPTKPAKRAKVAVSAEVM